MQQEFQELVKSKGWARLLDYAEGQRVSRESGKEFPAHTFDALVKNAGIDAELGGIRLFINLPKMAIDDFESQLDELKEVLANDRENSNGE